MTARDGGSEASDGGSDASDGGSDPSEVRFVCERCEKTFSTAAGLRAHQEGGRCKGAPPNVCPRCRRVFSSRQAKHAHVRRGGCTPAGVCAFMCENTDYLMGERCMQVLAGCAGPCDRLVAAAKLIWANGEHPENHNVRLKGGRRDVLEVWKNGLWYDAIPSDTFDKMISKAHALLARDSRLDANSMYEMPAVESSLHDSAVDLSGLDPSGVAELREREADERDERQARELQKHIDYVRTQWDLVRREFLCMVGSEGFRERSRVRPCVLRLRGVLPFDDVDGADADRIMEHPGNVSFTADECVRIHVGGDRAKHSVFPSMDGRTIKVRTRRGWVTYRRDYFPVLVYRKISAVMEERGYEHEVWPRVERELRERSGPNQGLFRRSIDSVLDQSLPRVRSSVVEEPSRLE